MIKPMGLNKINLVPLHSQKTRKLLLWITSIGVALLIINMISTLHFVNTNMLLWGLAFCLTWLNFSKMGDDENRDQIARYITLKLTFTFLIGFLMSTSFIVIFLNVPSISIKLLAALGGNIVFSVSHYVLYYIAMDDQTELHDESFKTLIQTQKPLLVIAVILSLITLLCIFLWF